jgi:hypothetical protein
MKMKLNRDTKIADIAQYAKEIKAKLISWQGRLYLYTSSGHAVEITTYE